MQRQRMLSFAAIRVVVFSDIDGTMTAPGFSLEETLRTLADCTAAGVGIVPVTSKTYAELTDWWHHPGILPCGVYETGFGIAVHARAPWHSVIARTVPRHGYTCRSTLGDWTVFEHTVPYTPEILRLELQARGVIVRFLREIPLDEFVRLSGLSTEAARRAYQRRGPEPFQIIRGSPDTVDVYARERGASFSMGKLLGIIATYHKGTAVRALVDAWRHVRPDIPFYAVGDAPSDTYMAVEGVTFHRVRDPEEWNTWMRALLRDRRSTVH